MKRRSLCCPAVRMAAVLVSLSTCQIVFGQLLNTGLESNQGVASFENHSLRIATGIETITGPEVSADEVDGAPRGGCNDLVYQNLHVGAVNGAGIAPGNQVGQGVVLIPGDWSICRVQARTANTLTPVGQPYDVRLRIWDACPTLEDPPAAACGVTGAVLLYESLADSPGTSAGLTLQTRTWTIPNITVPSTVWLTFEGTVASTFIGMDTSNPTIGTIAAPGGFTICGAANSGCNSYSLDGATHRVDVTIEANPVAGGTGACCLPDGCTEDQTVEQCNAADGEYLGADSTCAECTGEFCQVGGDGQKPDFNEALTSDANAGADLRVADNFTPTANSAITQIRWWGLYVDFTPTPAVCTTPPADSFTITFFDSAGNRPDAVIAGPFAVTPTRTQTPEIFAGGPTFRYEATIPAVNVTANTCHWMEIRNNTVGDCFWLWISSSIGDGLTAQSAGALPYPPGSNSDPDVSWCMNISVKSDGCDSAIELPGSCCLADGSCVDNQTSTQCDNAGGTFSGSGSSCAIDPCPLICQGGGEGQITDFSGQGAGGLVGSTSDLNSGVNVRVADNFTPAVNGSITSIRWWGFYNNFVLNQDCVTADSFTITFFNDAVDTPFQVLAGPIPVTPTRTNTGFQTAGRDVFEYQATIPAFAVTANQCVWMEIVNNTSGDCFWLWSTAPFADGISSQHGGDLPYLETDLQDVDMAWCVSADIQPDGCAQAVELAGACCRNGGLQCVDTEGVSACAAADGVFLGVGTTCAAGSCEGACCNLTTRECTLEIEDTCINAIGGAFQGIGSDCSTNLCTGSCCISDGGCVDTTLDNLLTAIGCEAPADGTNYGGSWIPGLLCNATQCPSFDQCDPDGLVNLACGSSTQFRNIAQLLHEAAGDPPPPQLPVFPDNPNSSCQPNSDGAGNFWVTLTGTGDSIEVTTCGSAVDDTLIVVYEYDVGSGCPTLLTISDEVACSDDDDACGPGSLQSRLCIPSTVAGRTYFLQVSSFTTVGNITVNVNCPCAAACNCPGDVGGAAGPAGDNSLDGEDVQEFVRCLLGTGTNCGCANVDGQNGIDLAGDIPAFVTRLLNGPTCTP